MVEIASRMGAPQERNWTLQVAHGLSSVLGAGKAIATMATASGKRDLSALWDLDPVAAPPRSIRQKLFTTTGPLPAQAALKVQLEAAMRRHDVERVRALSRQLRAIGDDAEETERGGDGMLRVGDSCFALAKVVEWEWYHARLVNVRARAPQLQIEYLATLGGNVSRLALPVPRVNHVPLEHVCLQRPQLEEVPIVPPSAPCVTVLGLND